MYWLCLSAHHACPCMPPISRVAFVMLHSRNRLLTDLDRWQGLGWISPEGAASIKGDLATRRSTIGLGQVLGTLAAVLIGLSAMSFVAANWHEMSKLARLAVIIAGLSGCFAAAAYLLHTGYDRFAQSCLLAAVAIFGAGIMMIAQMYQMDGHPPDAVWLWGTGAVIAGLLTKSNPVLAAALVIFAVWHAMEQSEAGHSVHWAFLAPLSAAAAGFAMTRWRPGLHLVCLALAGWVIEYGYLHNPEAFRGHFVVTIFGVGLAAVSIWAGPAIDRWRKISGVMMLYGFVVAFAGALAIQFIVDKKGEHLLASGAAILAAILAALAWSWRTDNKAALWAAYVAFSIEVLALYFRKIGSLLGTSTFFLVAGLFVAALAALAVRLHRETSAQSASVS